MNNMFPFKRSCRLMFEEEQRLGKGFKLCDAKELDRILLGTAKSCRNLTIGKNGESGKRPLSAYNAKTIPDDSR